MTKHLSRQAILNGVIIQIMGSILISIMISFITRIILTNRGYDQGEIRQFFVNQFDSVFFMLAGIVPNIILAFIVGYIVAKVAEQIEYWHALISISIVAVIYYGPAIIRAPLWFSLLSILGITVAALGGAGLCKKRKLSDGPQSDATGE